VEMKTDGPKSFEKKVCGEHLGFPACSV